MNVFMKRKIIIKMKSKQILLSTVTMMLFTVTACGSKDNSEAIVIEELVMVDTTADEEFSSEDIMTVDEWINTDDAATYIQALNTSLESTGAVITFEADGDILCMVFHYSEDVLGTDGSNLTEEQKEAEQTRLHEKYDDIKEQLEPMRDVFRDAIGDPDLVVRIIYRMGNGTELFSQDL